MISSQGRILALRVPLYSIVLFSALFGGREASAERFFRPRVVYRAPQPAVYYSSAPVFSVVAPVPSVTSVAPTNDIPRLPPIESPVLKRQGQQTLAKVGNSWLVVAGNSNGNFTVNGRPLPEDVAAAFEKYYCQDGVLSEYETSRAENALAFLSRRETLPDGCIANVRAALSRVGENNEQVRLLAGRIAALDDAERKKRDVEKKKADDAVTAEVDRLCKLDILVATEAERAKMVELVSRLTNRAKLQACLNRWFSEVNQASTEQKKLADEIAEKQGKLALFQEKYAAVRLALDIYEASKDKDFPPDVLKRLEAARDQADVLKMFVTNLQRETEEMLPLRAAALSARRSQQIKDLGPTAGTVHDGITDDATRFDFAQKLAGTGIVPAWTERTDIKSSDGAPPPPKAREYTKSPLDGPLEALAAKLGANLETFAKLYDAFKDDPTEAKKSVTTIAEGMIRSYGISEDEAKQLKAALSNDASLKQLVDRGREMAAVSAQSESDAASKDPLHGKAFTSVTRTHVLKLTGSEPPKYYEQFERDGKFFVRPLEIRTLTDLPPAGRRMMDATRAELFVWHGNQVSADNDYLVKNEAYFVREAAHLRTSGREALLSFASVLAGQYKALKDDTAKRKAFADTVRAFFSRLPDNGRSWRGPWDAATGGRSEIELVIGGVLRRFYEGDIDHADTENGFVVGIDDGKLYARKGNTAEELTELAGGKTRTGWWRDRRGQWHRDSTGGKGNSNAVFPSTTADGVADQFVGSDGVTYYFTGRFDGAGRPIYTATPSSSLGYAETRDKSGKGGTGGVTISEDRMKGLVKFLANPKTASLMTNQDQAQAILNTLLPKYANWTNQGIFNRGERQGPKSFDREKLFAVVGALAVRHRGTLKTMLGETGVKQKDWYKNGNLAYGEDRKVLEEVFYNLPKSLVDEADKHLSQTVLGSTLALQDPCARICDMWTRFMSWSEGAPDAFARHAKSDYDFAIVSMQAAAAASTHHMCPTQVEAAMERIFTRAKAFEKTYYSGKNAPTSGDSSNPYRPYGLRFAMMFADAVKNSPTLKDSPVMAKHGWIGNINRPGLSKLAGGLKAEFWTGGSALHFHAMATVANGLEGPERKAYADKLIAAQAATAEGCKKKGIENWELCAAYTISYAQKGVIPSTGSEPRAAAARIVPFAIMKWSANPNEENTAYLIKAVKHFVEERSGSLVLHGSADEVHYGNSGEAPYYLVPGFFQAPEAILTALKTTSNPELRAQLEELFPRVERLVAAMHMPNGDIISPPGQFGDSRQWTNTMGILFTAPTVTACENRPVATVASTIFFPSGPPPAAAHLEAGRPPQTTHSNLASPPPDFAMY